MNRKATWTIGLGLAFAAGTLALAITSLVRQPALPPPLTLSSGQTLILRGVTYGRNHVAPGTPPWLRLLPVPARQWLASRFTRTTPLFTDRATPDPRLLLWLEIQAGTATNQLRSTNVWLMLQDARGHASGSREQLDLWLSQPRAGQVIAFRAFPRRSLQMGVTFSQGSYDKQVIVGHWQIPNPARNTVEGWRAEATPVTRTNGDLACTLGALAAGTGNSSGFASERGGGIRYRIDAAKPGQEPGAIFPATFCERGVETNTWTIGSVTLADATGNLLASSGITWSQQSNTVLVHWDPVLWPDEGWELRLMAKRTPEAQFLRGEIARFKEIVAPAFDTPVNLDESIEVSGVTLRTKQLALRLRPDPDSWSSDQVSQLKLMITGLTNGLYLDPINATDDEGRTYRCTSWGGDTSSGAASEFQFSFPDMTNNVKRLTFSFAVQRGVPFTFRLKPDWAATNVSFRVKR